MLESNLDGKEDRESFASASEHFVNYWPTPERESVSHYTTENEGFQLNP